MNTKLVLLIVLFAVVIAIMAVTERPFEHFEQGLTRRTLSFAYTDSCPQCQKLKPIWEEQIVPYVRTYMPDMMVMATNCDTDLTFCEKFGIKSFPDIRIILGTDTHATFQGPFTFEEISTFVQKYPAVRE